MPRLIVECRSMDARCSEAGWEARLLIAVARAEDGAPVPGLQQTDFRVRGPTGTRLKHELEAGPLGTTAMRGAGAYALRIRDTASAAEPPDVLGSFPIGIQVRRHEPQTGAWALGQTVVRLPESVNARVLPTRARASGRALPGAGAALAMPRTDSPSRLRP